MDSKKTLHLKSRRVGNKSSIGSNEYGASTLIQVSTFSEYGIVVSSSFSSLFNYGYDMTKVFQKTPNSLSRWARNKREHLGHFCEPYWSAP
jgi:hypothetical protein